MSRDMNKHPQTSTGCSRAKAEGAFIALAAGDALGWPQEFPRKVIGKRKDVSPSARLLAWTRRGGGQYYPHEEAIQLGEYSDDTQLMLAVSRARMIAGNSWWAVLTRTELPLWTLYERGGGGATKRAAVSWIKGVPPWNGAGRAVDRYFSAGGNGVAMRILPHAVFLSGLDDPVQLVRDVILDGVATHGHPRALVGATAYAYAAWWLLRSERTIRFGELVDVLLENSSVWGDLPAKTSPRSGWLEAANHSVKGGYEALWNKVVSEMLELLRHARQGLTAGAIADDDEVLRALGCFGQSKGAGTVTTAAALYLCARYAPQPVQAVIKAAFAHGSDTDTVAAMAGGLVGCLAGSDWLPPEWFSVQDCDYLRRLANSVAQGPPATRERPKDLRFIGKKELEDLIAALVQGHKGNLNLDGVRYAQVTDMISPKPLSKTTIAQTWQIETVDGQTIYVTKLGRKSKADLTDAHGPESLPSHLIPGTTVTMATASGVKLSVTNIDSVASFYENVLGLKPIQQTPRFVSFGFLSLIEAHYASKLSGKLVDDSAGPGRHRIEIHVPDLSAAHQRAQNTGCVVQPITKMPWGQYVFHCRDPEGNVIEVSVGNA